MIDKLQQAKLLATFAHADQLYGSEPYMKHLEGVANIAKEFPLARDIGLIDVLIVSYLHDILEDTATPVIMLKRFGEAVTRAVVLLSKSSDIGYASYINDIKKDPLALLVKKADTLYNLQQSVLNGNTKRINKYTTQLQLLIGDNKHEAQSG